MPEADTISDASPVPSVEVIPGGPVSGSIRPPGSKSLTNRALICAAMADRPSRLTGTLASEDTEVMIEALRSIGVAVDVADGGQHPFSRADATATTQTASTAAPTPTELYIANSGTSIRFLTAALSGSGRQLSTAWCPPNASASHR